LTKRLDYYEEALIISPNEPTALKSLGLCILAQDNFVSALKNLNKAIESTSDEKI